MYKKTNYPINLTGEVSRTLKAQYYKNSIANFIHTGSYGATAVIVEITHEQAKNN